MSDSLKIEVIMNGRKCDISSPLATIADQYKMLCEYRDDGRIPSPLLLQDIAVYEFILKHDNPERAAASYLEMINAVREERKSLGVQKIEIARRLGWEIK